MGFSRQFDNLFNCTTTSIMHRFLYLVCLVALLAGSTWARSITFAVEKDENELSFTNDVLESTPVRPGWYNKVMKLLDNFRGGSIIFV